jgi:hypothetical protein
MANDEPRSVRVRRMILDIEDALKTETPAQVSSRFAEYQKEFPKIFELLLSRNYTRDILAMMIDQLIVCLSPEHHGRPNRQE